MRIKTLLRFLALAATLSISFAGQASATHDQPRGWGKERTVRHWVYRPRYNHVYVSHAVTDPYAYSYTPNGYYPYYNSAYWGRPYIKRFRGHLPAYYRSWGAPKRHYNHVGWHKRHYGGHRLGNW